MCEVSKDEKTDFLGDSTGWDTGSLYAGCTTYTISTVFTPDSQMDANPISIADLYPATQPDPAPDTFTDTCVIR